MKNISIKTADLLAACRIAERCLHRKHTIPILNHVLLQFSPGLLEVTATDLDSSVRIPVETSSQDEAAITVLGRVFIQTLSTLPDEYIGLGVTDKGKLLIERPNGDIKILSGNADEYPSVEFGKAEDYKYKFQRTELIEALKLSGFALETGNEYGAQAFKNSASLTVFSNLIESKFELMSTNEQILSIVNGLCEKKEGEEDGNISIPKQAITQLLSIFLNSTDEDVCLSETPNQIFVNIGTVSYSFRKSTVKFPDMSKAKTAEFPLSFTVDSESVNSSLKRMAILCDERTRRCLFTVEEDALTISTESGDKGEVAETFDIKLTGEPFDVSYSLSYLTSTLSRVTGDAELRFAESTGSYALKVCGGSDAVRASFFVQGLATFANRAAKAA